MLAGPLSMIEVAGAQFPLPGGARPAVWAGQDASSELVVRLEAIPDPRSAQGRRYRLSTLLAIGVCALSTPGYDSLTAVAEWARRADQGVLARLGAPFDPWPGRYLAPDEGTLREMFARVEPGALAVAGFARLKKLIPPAAGRAAKDARERDRPERALVYAVPCARTIRLRTHFLRRIVRRFSLLHTRHTGQRRNRSSCLDVWSVRIYRPDRSR